MPTSTSMLSARSAAGKWENSLTCACHTSR
jgi:hypothetical protein